MKRDEPDLECLEGELSVHLARKVYKQRRLRRPKNDLSATPPHPRAVRIVGPTFFFRISLMSQNLTILHTLY